MAVLNRRDYYAAIPQLEGRLSKLSKYITVEEGKLQIKIDDLYGNVATLTQTAESIESRVEGIEDDYVTSTVLTQTKNALTLEINEKAQVFTSQPTTPYYVGDLWTQGPNGEIYRCKTNRLSGNYTASDWEKASDYTDDTTANAEKNNRTMLIRSFGGGTITGYVGNDVGVYTNASGSVDIVELSWSDNTPSIDNTYASYGTSITFYPSDRFGDSTATFSGTGLQMTTDYGPNAIAIYKGSTNIFSAGTINSSSYSLSASLGGIDITQHGSQYYDIDPDCPLHFTGYTLYATAGISTTGINTSTTGDALIADSGSIKNKWAVDNATSDGNNMHIGTQGRIYMVSGSSKRWKNSIENIHDEALDPHHLYDIEVKQFKFNKDYIQSETDQRYDTLVPGFIAEQIQDVYPIAVDINEEDGQAMDWNMKIIIPPMLALIQEQHKEIEELKRRIECLNESRK